MTTLLVDDDQNVRQSLSRFLELEGFECQSAASGLEAQSLLSRRVYELILLDLRMPGMDGLELLAWITALGITTPVIILSAHGEVADAVQAMKLGARDYLTKPYDPEELLLRIRRTLHTAQLERRTREIPETSCYWGSSPQNSRNYTLALKAAATKSTILLTGESGTGKEVTAQWIHQQSPRHDRIFLPVNLASLPEQLMESELFGYEKGAFTGAATRREGFFETAQGGTLFLDEIGELPLSMQAAFLRVLQEGTVRRVGNPREIPVDIRVICATNRNLAEMVTQGTFRTDLYYRLNVIPITLPPLRHRLEDLPELTAILLDSIRNRLGLAELSVEPEAIRRLEQYRFPGNIRELENILERCAILSDNRRVTEAQILQALPELRPAAQTGSSPYSRSPDSRSPDSRPPAGSSLRELEKHAITAALLRHGGNRTHTAAELGITRKTLLQKIRDYGIE
ncbi:sigma-54-dependent transcriptional regulator [Spirochaeta lutea]|uniref:Chemotaxis protein CheY n=1 Tax=Spirochaeta lutea TaxID=1480694 RepID=A0A098QVT5_9SPIO|nr:sigma-54 dependent transcriptional regulator [Spirochaeta lutea]KGE71686.1 hypothetical protein DC28_10515 [Spirochaeta lutea]